VEGHMSITSPMCRLFCTRSIAMVYS